MLQDLANKLKTAKQPVTINSALIEGAGLTPPPNFDAELAAAFFPKDSATTDFQITFNADDVGDISGNQFQISNVADTVRLGQNFFNAAPSQTDCVLTFTQPDNSSPLQVQIEVALSGWKFSDYFTFMNGFPFNVLPFSQQSFVFSTLDLNSYRVRNVTPTISLKQGQNYVANFTVPASLNPLFNLISGFNPPTAATIFGSIVLNEADNAEILYPDMDLRAPLTQTNPPTGISVLGFMNAFNPFIGLQVKTVEETADDGDDGNQLVNSVADDPKFSQTPFLYLGVYLSIKDVNGKTLLLDFAAGKNFSDFGFGFSLDVDENSDVQLTPATVVGLMVGQSYFTLVPPELQQFLTKVGLLGLSVNGMLGTPPTISLLAISIGTSRIDAQQSPINFSDPTNNQKFTLETFDVAWLILNPLDSKNRMQFVTISSTFTLFPDVFKKSDGTPGGLFEVTLDQDLNVDGKFNGTASFDDLLKKITNGNIGLPNGVEASFSDVYFQLNPKVKSYSFGLTLNAEFNLIQWTNQAGQTQPLIQFQDFELKLAASTPTANGGNGNGNGTAKTVYDATINGTLNIGAITNQDGSLSPALSLNAFVEFDGTKQPSVWTLKTSLAQPLKISQLLNQFFASFDINNFPDFLPGDLQVTTFSIEATVPSKSAKSEMLLTDGTSLILADGDTTNQPTYKLAGKMQWELKNLPFGSNGVLTIGADVGLQYDGNKPQGQQFSGSVIGTVNVDNSFELMIGYSFGPAPASSQTLLLTDGDERPDAILADQPTNSQTLWVQWNGLRAEYKFADQTLTFRLTGWTVGKLLQELVRMIGNPYFTLSSPWDFLNQISLDGLSVTFDFKAKSEGKNWIYASYSLPKPVDLGFMTLKSIVFQRTNDGKVTLALDADLRIHGWTDHDPRVKSLFDPKGNGQNVQNLPTPTGSGNAYFDVRFLALGQRVGIVGSANFNSVQEVFTALEKIPSSQGNSNPVNPTTSQPGQPYYNPNNNWLIAFDFGLIQFTDPKTNIKYYTFDCKVVFNDPNLYGLRLALSGDKAKVLAGLVIDILYKKITDDVGVYQIDFSFPSIIRTLNFGAFTITLPSIQIKIYTNGDFFFDFGFPYNLDFSRSFSISAIIPPGIPVTGSAGFYFGKLSNATATQVPQTTKGIFNPVIIFGIGLQIGVGYNIDYGVLKAGFSITVFGIVEGVIAAFNPYHITDGSDGSLQKDYYFKLQGTIGLIGKLYGTVDFVIIKADVELLIQVYVQATYESYRAMPLVIAAHVSVKVSLKIDLWLFSITISFSFAMTVKAQVTIGQDEIQKAPWYDGSSSLLYGVRPRLTRERLMRLQSAPPELRFRTFVRPADVQPVLTMVAAPQFTVHQPDVTDTNPANQKGAFVLLLAMDAPTADGTGNLDGSSFESLCRDLLPWVIDALKNQDAENAFNLESFADESVSKTELEQIITKLSDTSTPAISADDIMTKFLQPNFTINVELASADNKTKMQNGSTVFPPLGGFSVTFPDPSGEEGKTSTITFDQYVTITETYRQTAAQELAKLAAQVSAETNGQNNDTSLLADDPEPFAKFVFEDYFLSISRQLIQHSSDALDDFDFPVSAKPANPPAGDTTDSLQSIFNWLTERGNSHIQFTDIAAPNLTKALTAGNSLVLSGINYTVQKSDTLQSIASRYSDSSTDNRWTTTPADIITVNQTLNTLILPGIKLSVNNQLYTTQTGDSFQSIAAAFKISVEQLAGQTSLYTLENFIAPAIEITVPDINYKTSSTDSLQGIMTAFSISLDAILANQTNLNCAYLFDANQSQSISIANLESLNVSDLWTIIKNKHQIGQIAGMVARYQLHGMRMPNLDGLALPETFPYPAKQPDYGIYQLTGQQFPTPTLSATPDYSISLGKDSSLSWVNFVGESDPNTLEIPLSTNSNGNASQAEQLFYLLQYAQGNVYNPKPTVSVQADAVVNPKRQSVKSAAKWSTSDQQKLISITAPPATVTSSVLAEAQQPQTQPILWQLPEGVIKDAEDREAKLSANSDFKFTDIINYLPVYQPQIGTTDPATHKTTFSAAENYAFSTRIDFQIKRLAQDDDQAPQTPLANDIVPPDSGISGSPAKELAPFTYELIGPNPSDALMLERLLTAMDSLGEGIISGLFILYPDSAVATSGLVSRADSEFLSFITQTNLSTETNPPPMTTFFDAVAEKQLNGIANSAADFIKMMWELSTVRSGGYYLYYEVIGQGAGLPDSLFDDSGAATLTLVIAYNRQAQPANGGRITNYVNSFVTTDAIDVQRSVMMLESQSSPDQTKPLSGTESLQNISDQYGVEVGLLAELNAQIAIPDKVQIPISGISRRITQSDISAGNVLENLAKYYSAGAEQAISATDISNFNPGVQPEVYSVFRIPPITYVVSSANAGSNFGSMQNYYDLSPDALADLARNVSGIFPQNTTLKTDSISRDVQPALGTGNVGIEVTRANPGDPPDLPVNPTKEQIEAFANGYLFSLYSLLTAGLYENAFFNPSAPGIPFGPRKPLSDEEAEAIRHPQARREMLTAQADEDFDYSQAIGFSIFSTKDACPKLPYSPNELLPNDPPNSKSPNPYIGVGTIAQVNLQWADIFGNRIVSTFTDSADNTSGALNNVPITIDYVDRLVGIGEWSNVRTYYSYAGTSANPVLNIQFELQTAAYQPPSDSNDPLNQLNVMDVPAWQQNAINDQKKFTTVYFQLNQNYDDLNIPGISGNAVSMYLTNTLLANGKTQLSSNDEQSIRQFVADCLVYIHKRADNQDGGTQPVCQLQIPLSISDISNDDIIELSVALTLERQSELCDPSLRASDGTSATTEIKPLMDAPSTNSNNSQDSDSNSDNNPNPQNLVYFADTFEPIFQTADWQMLVGSSAPDPSAPRGSQTPTVWAVRMGKKAGVGFYYEIGEQASFYAPKPIAQTMETATVSINNYTSGKSYPDGDAVSKTFTGVDLNSWANTALAAIDTFLAPNLANPAFIVDSLLISDPEKDGYLAKILQHKQTLSDAIAQTVIPILNTSADDYFSLAAAQEKLRQSLLNRLSNAFITTAITVFSASNVSVNPPTEDEVSPTRFYGQPQKYREGGEDSAKLGAADSDKSELNYSLTTGKIQYFPPAAGNAGEWRLPFIFQSKNIKKQTFVSLPLGYALTHLECNITNVPGIENYEQSTWIQFVNPPLNNAVGKINNNELVPTEFPVVLRALPTPPSITAQTAEPVSQTMQADLSSGLPSDLAEWNYSFSYEYNNSAQDSVTTVITLNGQNTLSDVGDEQSVLFTPLAQFISIYNDIFQDFETYLSKINASSKPTDTNVVNAQIALDAFEQIVGAAATAYEQWANPQPNDSLIGDGSATQVTYTFDIVLADGKDGNARIDVLKAKISPSGQTLPPPVIQIKPDIYKHVDAPDKPKDALVSYNYELKTSPPSETITSPSNYLSYKDALNIPDRTIELCELNVFNRQNSLAQIQVLRNEYLLPENMIKTNTEFQFGTPQVKFANSAIPSLDYLSFDLGTLEVSPPTLDGYLNAFFDSLFTGVSGILVLVKMTGVFSYNLLPEISDFPNTNIPIALLPPIEVTPETGQHLPVVAMFATAVTDWIKSTKPVINSSSKLSFGLEIFAGSGNQSLQMPLLSIGSLFIDAEKLKFS